MSNFWNVHNCITELDDGRHRERDITKIKKIVIHRVGLDKRLNLSLGETGPEIAKQFLHNPEVSKYTGGENPYTFYVKDKDIWQALPVDEVGNHARRWNVPGLGIACIGDFRYDSPSDDTFQSVIKLCDVLIRGLALEPWDVGGHTELGSSATNTPGKECPGERFDLDFLRHELLWTMCPTLEERLRIQKEAQREPHGIVWDGL